MREIVIIMVVLAIIFGVNNITETYTDSSLGKIDELLKDLRTILIDKNNSKAIEKIDEILNKWEEKSEVLSYYIEHDELEKIETYLIEIKSDIDNNDFIKAIENLDVCEFIISHMNEKQGFLLKNIF